MKAPADIPTLMGLGLLLVGVVALLMVGVGLAGNWLVKRGRPAALPVAGGPPLELATSMGLAPQELRDLARSRDDPDDVPWALAIGVPDREMKPLLPSPNAEGR